MFENTSKIENLYSKINELNVLSHENYVQIKNIIFCIMIGSIFMLFTIMFNLKTIGVELSAMLALIFLMTGLLSTIYFLDLPNMKVKRVTIVFSEAQRKVKEKEEEIISYISNEDIQREILKFKKFELLDEQILKQLKKYLALKDFTNAYLTLLNMIEDLKIIEKQNQEQLKTDKLIADYELDLNMNL